MFRSSLHESIFRALRDEFDRFPNLEYEDQIGLGQIGVYDGKRCKFEWRTDLTTLGVVATPAAGGATPPIVNNVYTSGSSTTCSFSVAATGVGVADFSFPSSRSIAAQALAISSTRYDIGLLEIALNEKIAQGLNWNHDWVVVTQVFPADSYSLLYSRSRNTQASISTNVAIPAAVFNIADPALGLTASKISGEFRSTLAQKNVTPFFRVHKLKGWRRAGNNLQRVLEPYGRA